MGFIGRIFGGLFGPRPIEGAAESPSPEPVEEGLASLRRRSPTGSWHCTKCEESWASDTPAPEDWGTRMEGQHRCPSCGSWWMTHPV